MKACRHGTQVPNTLGGRRTHIEPKGFAPPPSGSVRRVRSDRELDRRIAALALPALGSIAAEPAYSLVDTAIVGHLGRVPLDSLAIATTALNMTAAMILAILAYVPVAALVLRFPRLGLPGVWIALGLWLAARAALLGQRWQAQFRDRQ